MGGWKSKSTDETHGGLLLSELIDMTMAEVRVENRYPASYKYHAERFKQRWPDQVAADLTPRDVEGYAKQRFEEGIKPGTVRHELAFLSRCYRLAVRESLLPRNPVLAARKPKVRNGRTRVLTHDEEARLADVLYPEQFELVKFAVFTGVRRLEQFSLRVEDIDTETKSILVRRGKNGMPRHVPLHPEALEIALRWADRGGGPWVFYPDRCFVDPSDRYRTGEWWYNRVWRPALPTAGIEGLKWHDLRHTCASRMIQADVPESTVSRVLGHVDPMMTRRYCHHAASQLQEAVETIQFLPGPAEVGRPRKASELTPHWDARLERLEGALGRLAAAPQQQAAMPDPSTDLAARLERLEGVLGRLVTAIEGGNRV